MRFVDPDSIPITVFALELSPQVLDEYAAAGVARVAQLLPPDTHDEAMKAMDA